MIQGNNEFSAVCVGNWFIFYYMLCSMMKRQIDPAVGANAVVSILLPTAGERLDVVLKCLLGASSQRSWPSTHSGKGGRGDGLRVIVLDEKRRKVC